MVTPPKDSGPPFDTGRARDVIEKVVEASRFRQRPAQAGHAKGFGFYFSHRGYFAEVVEASVSEGAIRVHEVWVAGDVGSQIINPFGAENQVRGSILDGLAQVLDEQQIEIVDGVVQQGNFHDFRLGRMNVKPPIHIAWVKSEHPPTGLGEPSLPPVLPALTNAVFAASGQRIRSLPARLIVT